MGLLHLRSRPQRRFKMSVNVCPDDIFWITEHFVTKFGMVMQHHEPECRAELVVVVVAIFKVKVTARVHMIKIWLSLLYFSKLLILWQPNLVWWYIIISHCVLWEKIWISSFKITAAMKGQMSLFVGMISSKPPSIFFQTWYCDASLWVGVSCKKIDLLFSRSKSLQELIWPKYDNFYCTFWTADPFATKLGLIVHYYKAECFMEKLVCYVQGQGHSNIS